mmetsp:Transcript_13530/g.23848  ORF Transcript_13530/g.23848 Transcript_13530/m.23848 type:complete len:249 (-) Transcript_13530:231-977(-)
MAQQQWQRAVAANQPVSFGGGDAVNRLELRGCCLTGDASGPGPTLYCSVAGGPPLALARPSPAKPYCQVRFALESDAGEVKFTCKGAGQILLVGVVQSLMDGVIEPPSKKARIEPVMSTRSSPTVSATAPAGSPNMAVKVAASPKTKPSSPVAKPSPPVAKAAAPAKPSSPAAKPAKVAPMVAYASSAAKPEQSAAKPLAKEPLVTHRSLPSGLRYEVLKVGNGLQAKPGKKSESSIRGSTWTNRPTI